MNMNHVIFMALIATIGTWSVTALGAMLVIFFKKENQRIMNLTLGFAAGVMIAASFWSLLQPAIERAEAQLHSPAWLIVTLGFLCGAFFMWIADKTVSYTRSRVSADRMESGEAEGSDGAAGSRKTIPSDRMNRIILLVLSITLHNIPEGMAVGVAFGALHGNGYSVEALMGAITMAVGIGLQNFPEGAAVSLPLRREGCSRKKSFLIGQASAIVEPIAGVLGAVMVVHVQAILPFVLAFAAGAMILVAVHELIPECQRNQKGCSYFVTNGIMAGFALMMLLDVALG